MMYPLQIGSWQVELWKLSSTLAERQQAKCNAKMDKNVFVYDILALSLLHNQGDLSQSSALDSFRSAHWPFLAECHTHHTHSQVAAVASSPKVLQNHRLPTFSSKVHADNVHVNVVTFVSDCMQTVVLLYVPTSNNFVNLAGFAAVSHWFLYTGKQHAAGHSHDRELPPCRDDHLGLHAQTPGVAVPSLGGH